MVFNLMATSTVHPPSLRYTFQSPLLFFNLVISFIRKIAADVNFKGKWKIFHVAGEVNFSYISYILSLFRTQLCKKFKILRIPFFLIFSLYNLIRN